MVSFEKRWNELCGRVRQWWHQDGQPPGADAPYNSANGDELLDQIADAEALARHAIRQGLAVAEADLTLLGGARASVAALRSDTAARTAFFGAVMRVSAAGRMSAAELRATTCRLRRLWPQLTDAQNLLYFAAAKGNKLEPETAAAILAAVNAAQAGTLNAAQEAEFLAAYRTLAATMDPVTASTLLASETRFPKLMDFFARPRAFFTELGQMTLGRFLHFFFFTGVLVCTGAAIAYQTIGEAALAKFETTAKDIDQSRGSVRKARLVERERLNTLLMLQKRKDARQDDIDAANLKLQEAMDEVRELDNVLRDRLDERARLPATLGTWATRPCGPFWVKWSCIFSVAVPGDQPQDREIVFDAEMTLKRLNSIVLPMLLGLLGAYSFVLRSISREIKQRSFEEHSFLHHLVRLSLGALAGIAAGWVLKPEQVGLLASVPAWVLAFVAGYGIELVFAFLDRTVASFTSKQAEA